MRGNSVSGVAIVACALLAADTLGAQSTFTVRDSAGVRIVENVRPAWTRPWVIGEQPITRIGGMGQPEQELSTVVSATRLSGGSIVVADAGPRGVSRYSSTGVFLGRLPGTFTSPFTVFALPGDSIATVDIPQGPLSIHAADGTLVRTVHIYGEALPISRFADGRYLMSGWAGWPLYAEGPARVERLPMEVALLTEGAGDARQLLLIPGPEVEVGPSGSFGPDGGARIVRRARPFGRMGVVAANATGWVLADTERAEIQFRRPSGELATVARWPAQARAVTPEDIETDRALRVSRQRDPAVRARMEASWDQQPPSHATMPVLANVLLDSEGNAWAEHYAAPGETAPGRFDVIDPRGGWLGTVQGPPGLIAIAVGDDWLLGLIRDEFGPDTLLVLSIDKN